MYFITRLNQYRAELAVSVCLLLCGCAQSLGRFDSIVYEKLPEEGITLASPPQPASLAMSSSPPYCVHSYFLFADKAGYDLETIIKSACSPGRVLRQAEIKRNYYYVPLIYGQDCVNVDVRCEK